MMLCANYQVNTFLLYDLPTTTVREVHQIKVARHLRLESIVTGIYGRMLLYVDLRGPDVVYVDWVSGETLRRVRVDMSGLAIEGSADGKTVCLVGDTHYLSEQMRLVLIE